MILNEQWGREYRLVFKNLERSENNTFEITQLRIEFDIEMYVDQKEKSNVGTIDLYNLKEQTFKDMDCKNGYVWLYAGYQNNLALIMEGDVINVATKRNGNDRVTELKMADGFRDLTIKKLTPTTLPESITAGAVVRHIASDLGIAIGTFVGTWQNTEFLYGYPLSGNGKIALDNICRANDLEWKLVDGALAVTERYGLINKNPLTAYVISKDSGMIDLPYRFSEQVSKETGQMLDEEDERIIPKKVSLKKDGTPRKTKTETARRWGVKVRALLNPNVKPNSLIKIETDSTLLNGYYRVRSVIFKGDTRGGEWWMDIYGDSVEAEELQG